MTKIAQTQEWVKKMKALTLALVFSGALNVGLLAAFVFFGLEERNISIPKVSLSGSKQLKESNLEQMILEMEKNSFHELVSFLTNRQIVDEGYCKRDLAVGLLTSQHYFNLEKALSFIPSQRRKIVLSSGKAIELFPGLTEEQFQGIIRFAYQEKWPLTSKGIFKLLKKWPDSKKDSTLVEAFLVTPEFYSLQLLFQKTEAMQDPNTVLKLALEGNWDVLDRFAKEQNQLLDLSVEKRRRLLLSYLALQSPTAAELLLKTDFQFALKKLEDQGAIDLIRLLSANSVEGERLCLDLLAAPRSDAVWEAAVRYLYEFSLEALPEPFDLKIAMSKFVAPEKTLNEDAPQVFISQNSPFIEHVVKEGESLWKISRIYKVKVDAILQQNQMDQDRLYPGMVLRIPK